MRAPRVDGGRVLSATVANELVKPVAEVLYLTGSQVATNSHQLGVMRVVVTPPRTRVSMTTSSPQPDLGTVSGPCPRQVPGRDSSHFRRQHMSEDTRPFQGRTGGRGGDGVVSQTSCRHSCVLSLVNEFLEKVQPEEKRDTG